MTRIRLEGYILDTDARQLTRGGSPVPLAPKVLELLNFLITRRPNAIAKAAIHEHLWPGTYVAQVNLPVLVHRLREALADDPRDPRFVRTVARFGYAFCGNAWVEGEGSALECPFEYCVEFAGQVICLRPGDNLLGRTHDAVVRVDQTSVSRRHALIRISESGATIQDCGSRNGTFRGKNRVTEPVALGDGDRILLGTAVLTFRCRRREDTGADDSARRPTTPVIVDPENAEATPASGPTSRPASQS